MSYLLKYFLRVSKVVSLETGVSARLLIPFVRAQVQAIISNLRCW